MAKSSRKVPRGARPARRALRAGGTADGYIQAGAFYPFDTSYGPTDFTGAAYADSTVQCDTSSSSGSSYGGSSYDSGSSSYDSGSSSSSYDSGSSSY